MKKICFLCMFLFLSCGIRKECNSKIQVSEVVLYEASKSGIDYCYIVNQCLEGDVELIKKMFLSSPEYLDGESVYLHFYYVYEIAIYLGEDKIISIAQNFSQQDLKLLYISLDTGIATFDSSKSVRCEFPKLFKVLWNSEAPKW